MTLFEQVKECVTARQAAEHYGIKVKRNGMACCPFHKDRHPSMKADKIYHCFACGVGGDAIDFTARLFGISQYEAAKKLIEDFGLDIKVEDRNKYKRTHQSRNTLISKYSCFGASFCICFCLRLLYPVQNLLSAFSQLHTVIFQITLL